jgi:hypothetical protein
MLLGKQSGVGKTVIVAFAKYDMVQNADAEDFRSFYQAACAVSVFPRGSGISGRMLCMNTTAAALSSNAALRNSRGCTIDDDRLPTLMVSVLNIDALVRDRLAYKVAIVHEKAFMSGSGTNQPLGLFTASDKGISTARDVSTGNTATTIGADNLFEMVYSLKGQYLGRPSTRWIWHRLALKMIRKLQDNNKQYLWQPGLTQGQPDTILGIGIINSEHAPSTFTTGQYVGILGDFSFYWIVDALDAAIQVLDQLYAESNQTGYIIRAESDAMPVLEEAFVRSKLA